jgi:predicted lipid-binding transport protein (Tim44 family)
VGLIGAFLIYRAVASRRSGGSAGSGDTTPAPVDAAAVHTAVSALQARDPNFNQQVFIDRAQATFFVLQNAWMARNLEPARIYLSDAIYQRWKLQVDQFVAMHKRDVLEDLAVNGCTMAQVASDPNFDSITVRFDAIAKDYEADDAGKMISGDKTIQPFTEYWTFIRSQAARTRVGDTAQITQCPNCGAPVSINESGVCAYCKATVTTGQFGWVLNNITQASEWSAAA